MRAGSQRNCRKSDEVNVKFGIGSFLADSALYGVPNEMRYFLGGGGCVGILGMLGAGWLRAAVASQSTDEKKR